MANEKNVMKILPKVILKEEVLKKEYPIVQIHIPKTGGTNLDCLGHITGKLDGFRAEKASTAVYNYGRISHITFKDGFTGYLEKIKSKPLAYNLIKRNMKYFGAHMAFPEEDGLFGSPVNYIAVIREPIAKAISLVNFMISLSWLDPVNAEDYILNVEIDNLQTRLLAGESFMSGECNNNTFTKALDNIQNKFSLVAPTEDVQTLVAIVANYMGHTDWVMQKVRTNDVRSFDGKNIMQQIIDRNFYDIELYKFVQKHWNEWKEKNIESIDDNYSDNKSYLVMSERCFKPFDVKYMSLAQLNEFNAPLLGEVVSLEVSEL